MKILIPEIKTDSALITDAGLIRNDLGTTRVRFKVHYRKQEYPVDAYIMSWTKPSIDRKLNIVSDITGYESTRNIRFQLKLRFNWMSKVFNISGQVKMITINRDIRNLDDLSKFIVEIM